MKYAGRLIITILGLSLLTACTPNISPDSYKADSVGGAQQVSYGKIVQVNPVEVTSNNEGVGTLIGAGAGATAGSAIGGGTRANILGALGGAVVGGLAGHEVGKHTGNQTGMQYIVKLDSGKTVSVVQGAKPPLHVGQRVMVLTGGGQDSRVVAAY